MDDVQSLSDEAIALTDAMKGLIEIFLVSGIAKPGAFDRMYRAMRDDKLKLECVKGAAIMEMLRLFATDPARATHREGVRIILQEPPQGSA